METWPGVFGAVPSAPEATLQPEIFWKRFLPFTGLKPRNHLIPLGIATRFLTESPGPGKCRPPCHLLPPTQPLSYLAASHVLLSARAPQHGLPPFLPCAVAPPRAFPQAHDPCWQPSPRSLGQPVLPTVEQAVPGRCLGLLLSALYPHHRGSIWPGHKCPQAEAGSHRPGSSPAGSGSGLGVQERINVYWINEHMHEKNLGTAYQRT